MLHGFKKCKTLRGIALPAIALCALISAPPRPASAAPPAMGVNVEGIADWSASQLFTDMLKQSRHWGTAATPWDETMTEDSNGWPTADAGVVLESEGHPIIGTYKLTFTGQATVAGNASNVTVSNQIYNSGTNITTADLALGSGQMILSFTNTKRTSGSATNTGITNVRLIRPGYAADGSVTFTTPFKNELAKFSVLRFMDFGQTNGNQQVNWTDRRLPSYATQCGSGSIGGGAWEYAIQLCNETGKDMYINIPEHATDAYITSLAGLIKNGDTVNGVVYPGLNSTQKVYIEWSNEVWNGSFEQCNANHNDAIAEVNLGGSPLNFDGDTNSWDWAWRRIAKRIIDTSNIFRTTFGDAAMITRIRPVLEWQYDNAQNTANLELGFIHYYYNNGDGATHVGTPHPANYFLWGAGGATYYGSNNDSASTVDLLYASGIPNTSYAGTCNVEANWAKSFGLNDTAYEGGWSVGGTGNDTATQQAAHYDIRAKQSLIDAQNIYSQAGGDLNIFYASSGGHQWTWGMTDDMTNLATPLLQGVDALNLATAAAPTNGTSVAATGTTTIQAASLSTNDHWFGGATVPLLGDSDRYKGFVIRIGTAGTYQVQLSVANPNTGGQMRIYVDGALAASVTVPNTGSASTYVNTSQVPVALSAGMHGIVVSASANATSSAPFAGNFAALLIGNGTITVPSAPTGLAGTGGYQRANLTWTSASGATSYNVYRGTAAGAEAATAVATGIVATSYSNTGLTNGTTYYFKVTGVNSAGESAKSNEASVVPVDNAGHILQTATAPVIDGTVDTAWNSATAYNITHISGTISNGADCSATWKGLWDSTNLYVLANVTDDVKTNDSTNNYDDDAVEVFIDGDNSKGTVYDGDDIQYIFGWNDTVFTASGAAGHATGVAFAEGNPSGTNYIVEVKIPWTSIGDAAVANNLIGIDVHVDDDDDGGGVDGKIMWNDTTNSAWNNPSVFGLGLLQPSGGSAPAAPTGLTATAGNAQAALSWTASTGATSYNVKRSTVNGSGYATVSSPTVTNYTNTGLTNGTTYYYVVTAVNASGESGNSNQASATPAAAPAAPTGLTATPGYSQVALTWTASAGATTYNVSRSTVSGSGYASVATGIGSTAFTNVGLTNGTTYYFVVSATNASGTSANSAQASAAPAVGSNTLLATEPFGEATGASNAANGGTSWGGGWDTQNGDVTVPGYNIATATPLTYSTLSTSGKYAVGGNAFLTAGRLLDTSTVGSFGSNGYVSGGLIGVSGKTLWMSVLMRKDAATEQTNSVTLHPNGIPHWANPPLLAVGYFGAASDNAGSRFWSLQIGSTVFQTTTAITTGATALLVVKIDFAATNTVSLYVNPASLGGSAPGTASASGTTTTSLAFQGIAYYAGDGAGQSSLDEIRFGTTYAAVTPTSVSVPAAPTGLTATGSNAQIALSWNASTGATSYNVKRSTVSGSGYATVASPATTSYTNTGLTNGTTYYYVVTAVNTAGESGNSSQASAAPYKVAIKNTATAPVIDGTIDAVWSSATAYTMANNIVGTAVPASDISGTFKAMWDATNLYVLFQITDDVKVNDSTNNYDDDAVEVFLDGNYSHGSTYDNVDDVQYVFGWGDATFSTFGITGHTAGITFAKADPTGTTYVIELKIPWSTIGGTATTGRIIGFDGHVDDDDDGGARDNALAYSDTNNTAWSTPSVFAAARLN